MSLYRHFVLYEEPHIAGCIAFLKNNWKACADRGKPLLIEIREKNEKRTLEQNKRLHAILRDVADHAWVNGKQFDQETWKEHFRRLYIGSETIDLPDGTRIERGISTTRLTVDEFNKFMTQIEAYSAEELGIVLA